MYNLLCLTVYLEFAFSLKYSYDFSGNIVSFKDGNKNITEYNYDGLGRVLKRVSPEGSTKEYRYDYMGNIEKLIFSGAYGNDVIEIGRASCRERV